ncbi:MAG: amidohydrolase family protein, partial [Firmicutes bacterium]|nr:amidohydrolase family protein [Bacillota bacterium]
MTAPQVIAADLTWTGEQFESGILVVVGDDGRIHHVGRSSVEPTVVLRDRALLPGAVNAHSHAFQLGLRGLGEQFPTGPDSFWTWREAMYGLVERIEPEEFVRISERAFAEMRASGITSVGEFHYLHHTAGTCDFSYDRLLLEAACRAGIRLVLLASYYRTGGIGQPLRGAQRRFAVSDPAAYFAQLDQLASTLGANQSLGVAVHSLRATPMDDLATIHQESLRRGMVFHLHMEEQRREVDEALTLLGRTPMRVLLDSVDTARNITAVHCTHTSPPDADAFIGAGGRICLCPLTEANLG